MPRLSPSAADPGWLEADRPTPASSPVWRACAIVDRSRSYRTSPPKKFDDAARLPFRPSPQAPSQHVVPVHPGPFSVTSVYSPSEEGHERPQPRGSRPITHVTRPDTVSGAAFFSINLPYRRQSPQFPWRRIPWLQAPAGLQPRHEAGWSSAGRASRVGDGGIRLAPGAAVSERGQGAENLAVGMLRNREGSELCGTTAVSSAQARVMRRSGPRGRRAGISSSRAASARAKVSSGRDLRGRAPPEGESNEKIIATTLNEFT